MKTTVITLGTAMKFGRATHITPLYSIPRIDCCLQERI
jgi:hypothetical protein